MILPVETRENAGKKEMNACGVFPSFSRGFYAGSGVRIQRNKHGDIDRLDSDKIPVPITYTYDSSRRLIGRTDQFGKTEYSYDSEDRLCKRKQDNICDCYKYDYYSRLSEVIRNSVLFSKFSYDSMGRIQEAISEGIRVLYFYDATPIPTGVRVCGSGPSCELRFIYSQSGLLEKVLLGPELPEVSFRWNNNGWLSAILLTNCTFAGFDYDREQHLLMVHYENGTSCFSRYGLRDGRTLEKRILTKDNCTLKTDYAYDAHRRISDIGEAHYRYDSTGRLAEVRDGTGRWSFSYTPYNDILTIERPGGIYCFQYDCNQFPENLLKNGKLLEKYRYNELGMLTERISESSILNYQYDNSGKLSKVYRDGDLIVHYLYDYKGRLIERLSGSGGMQTFLYDEDDRLWVIHGPGKIHLFIQTPMGIAGEIFFDGSRQSIYTYHTDDKGTCFFVTDENGRVCRRFSFSPFGEPLQLTGGIAWFKGKWFDDLTGLYWCGARWYDPFTCRFLTPDTWNGAPDDERVMSPFIRGSDQVVLREMLDKESCGVPQVLNRYSYCLNDPVNKTDPNGHWAFGNLLLSVLGAVWTLPNTLVGLFLEIGCLLAQGIRNVFGAFTATESKWHSPSVSFEKSDNLNSYGVVFRGGWLGSIEGLLGITFGNIIFVNGAWEQAPRIRAIPDPGFPAAYNGTVALSRDRLVYEHELRHVKQQGWFGPFYHLGLPLFGIYEWDLFLHGGDTKSMLLEADACNHAETQWAGSLKEHSGITGTISGKIEMQEEMPSCGLRLAFTGVADPSVLLFVQTDAQGCFELHDVPCQLYRVLIEEFKIADIMQEINCIGAIKGAIVSEDFEPESKIHLSRISDGSQISSVWADSFSEFTFKEIPEGRYLLAIENHEVAIAQEYQPPLAENLQAVTGVVKSEEGLRVNDLTVILADQNNNEIARDTTDHEGRYVVAAPAAGTYSLRVLHAEIAQPAMEEEKEGEKGSLYGRLYNESDRPVVGQTVLIRDDFENIIASVTTNEDGLFKAEGIPEGDYHIEIENAHIVTATPVNLPDTGEGAGTLLLHAECESLQPFSDSIFIKRIEDDADKKIKFSREGEADLSGLFPGLYSLSSPDYVFAIIDDETKRRQKGRILGRLCNETGESVANLTINLISENDPIQRYRAITGANGTYDIRTELPGPFYVQIDNADIAPLIQTWKPVEYVDYTAAINGRVSGEAGADVKGLNMHILEGESGNTCAGIVTIGPHGSFEIKGLKPGKLRVHMEGYEFACLTKESEEGTASITGCALDEEGKILADITIELFSGDRNIGSVLTRSDGTFSFGNLKGGTYRLNVKNAITSAVQNKIPSGKSVLNGCVLSESGATMPNITIRLCGQGNVLEIVSDCDGRFSLEGIAPGSYDVEVNEYECALAAHGREARGGLYGAVVDYNNIPVANAEIVLADFKGKIIDKKHTSSKGAYEFTDVPEGDYLLSISGNLIDRGDR